MYYIYKQIKEQQRCAEADKEKCFTSRLLSNNCLI